MRNPLSLPVVSKEPVKPIVLPKPEPKPEPVIEPEPETVKVRTKRRAKRRQKQEGSQKRWPRLEGLPDRWWTTEQLGPSVGSGARQSTLRWAWRGLAWVRRLALIDEGRRAG